MKNRTHISPEIPSLLQPDINALTDYLWTHMDHNAFLTLNGLWFVWNEADYIQIARFHACGDAAILPEHRAKGCMWYARQVCIVDVKQIVLYWQRKQPGTQHTPDTEDIAYLRRDLLVTALHELRHLLLDTNPALWDDYPAEFATEFQVERYAQEICEYRDISHIFIEKE